MFEENGSVVIERGGEIEKKNFQAPDRFRVQLEHFSDCVLHKKPLEFPIDDGLRNVAVYESLLESVRSGRRVEVPAI
jgi:predicted dehydrogenase